VATDLETPTEKKRSLWGTNWGALFGKNGGEGGGRRAFGVVCAPNSQPGAWGLNGTKKGTQEEGRVGKIAGKEMHQLGRDREKQVTNSKKKENNKKKKKHDRGCKEQKLSWVKGG